MTLDEINQLSPIEAYELFESCCASGAWVRSMVESRPYTSLESLLGKSLNAWAICSEVDYLAAFEGHPQIGDVSTLKEKFRHTEKIAGHEQVGMESADDSIFREMKQLNDQYYEKNGFIFIVFATGKSASEMLNILKKRLDHPRSKEIIIAADEQKKITQLRLTRLFSSEV